MVSLFGDEPYAVLRRSADISECGKYRWSLRRWWTAGGDGKSVCFVMLNPSTANAIEDDPTIRRCLGFVRAWGHSSLIVRNLYPYRATDPKELRKLTSEEASGGERGRMELALALTSDKVVVAWGGSDTYGRATEFFDMAKEHRVPLWCLGKTKAGYPRHPLYLKTGQPLEPFKE